MHIRKLAQTAGPLFLSILLPDAVYFVFCAKISFHIHCVFINYVRRFFAFLEVGVIFPNNNNNNNNNNAFSANFTLNHTSLCYFCCHLLKPGNILLTV